MGHKDNEEVKGSTLLSCQRRNLQVEAVENARFLLFRKAINEEIARGGPFVMNTREEILEAMKITKTVHL